MSHNRYIYSEDDPVNKMDVSGRDDNPSSLRGKAELLNRLGAEYDRAGLHDEADSYYQQAAMLLAKAIAIEKQRADSSANPLTGTTPD